MKTDREILKYLIIIFIVVNLFIGFGLLAFHYFGNNFLLLIFLSSPFLIIFGMFFINALAKINNEKGKQKKI
ncbi:hypothetical protein NG99_03250 [Erwinia typographi]|uniref:Uncharacterized protein n=1 Tax=Erwinia typographi TaxID=371042 RepID=A0A0A3ZD39_9GAMM|nr:hypothetical protein [Erwinia typographi]KGT95531.1 hypothetical protein NG99_03250 [Erwinia typographi]